MFLKADIRKVTIALEKSLGHEVYMRLGDIGIIHPARMQTGEALMDAGISAEEARTHDIIGGISFVLNALNMEPGDISASLKIRDQEEDRPFVSGTKKIIERLQRLRTVIQEQQDVVSEQLEYAEALNVIGIEPESLKRVRLARVVFGRIADAAPEPPPGAMFAVSVAGHYALGTAMEKNTPEMLRYFREHGFIDRTSDVSGISLDGLKRREISLRRRRDALDAYADRIRKEAGPELIMLYHSYKEYQEVLKAMRLSGFSDKAIFITGWIDEKDKPRLVVLLEDLCGGRYMLSDERDPNAPVRMRNSRLFKPFELIVKTMGMPANDEIDPTPLAAITFVLVFGLMFGDLGQGLVLAISGLVMRHIARKKSHEDLDNAGGILFVCGLFAAFCGVLYGSLFSSEELIPALWIRPSDNIMRLFSVTILLGAVIIVAGLCVNIINAFINRDYAEALLEKKGAAVLMLYTSVVIFAVSYMTLDRAPGLGKIVVFLIAPLAVFSLRGIIGPAFFNAKRPHDMGEYVTETVMDIVEIALSMFANTVSFVRVGAFALSHAGLSIVTYTLAGMADPGLKSASAVAIVIMGNIFIVGFEGLICGIQSMRLEYYEFFSKFYKGDGVVFSPFIIKGKMSEV